MYTIMLRKTLLQVMALKQLGRVGWRGALVLERIHCSSRGSEYSFQHLGQDARHLL